MTQIRFRENADFMRIFFFFENFITGARFVFAQRYKLKTATETETETVLNTKKKLKTETEN